MGESLLFCNVDVNEKNKEIVEMLIGYSNKSSNSVYIIDAPLGTDEPDKYAYSEALIVLVPKHKICFIDLSDGNNDGFEDFFEDFIEDLGHLSEKFGYRKQLGRPRIWKDKYSVRINKSDIGNIEELMDTIRIENINEQRTGELLISLLIGSINDINRIGGEHPSTVLDQIKKKIILFDADQSRFIYSKQARKKSIVIQGLAGTGKTELLLHKLKDIYVKKKDSRIVFTCFNKILAQSMRKRIPDFFDFMRVDEQIQWNTRLFVMPSWGSKGQKETGVYSYICSTYNLEFHPFSYKWDFEEVCNAALAELKGLNKIEECFDYMFIDESQDFPESFFELCKVVTKQVVYVAGDIFQDIYDRTISRSVSSDYLLNKCYRTDPKTLMFAHAVGMGLYEQPVIRWLDDDEWKACGYSFKRDGSKFILSRKPLRRFEDLDTTDLTNIEIISSNNKSLLDSILDVIDSIRNRHETVCASDIAVVFLEGNKLNYDLADYLSFTIAKKYSWDAIKGYETKDSNKDAVFISNRNNIKGLEFPFVICVVSGKVTENIFDRNTLYMMLTRSFITSYFVVNDGNADFIAKYQEAARGINESGVMALREPPEIEKEQQNQKVSIAVVEKQKSLRDIVEETLNEFDSLTLNNRNRVIKMMIEYVEESGTMTEQEIRIRTRKIASGVI